jgi:pSer/pThr/pTyr-binding forkhead associated (FHA) protein
MSYKLVKVGRAKDNDIVLTDASVSRYHCEFFFDESGNVFLTDKDSSNGTFVNGSRISGSVQLNTNDIVKPGLDLPLRWRTYNEVSNGQSNQDYSTTNEHLISHNEPISTTKKINGIIKTILITLGIITLIIGVVYAVNEYSSNSKPEPVDSEKPNDISKQPEKSSKEIIYDFSCLEDENDYGSTKIINKMEELESGFTDFFGSEVSIAEEEKVSMHKNVLDFEPHLALFVRDIDPLLFYKSITQAFLGSNQTHTLYFELSEFYTQALENWLPQTQLKYRLKKDAQGKPRMLKLEK